MIPRQNVPSAACRLLSAQAGVISREQAIGVGLSDRVIRRLLRQQYWATLVPGVYTLSADPTWRGRAWAGLLLGGEESVLGGQAAAHLHGLGEAPSTIHVWVGRDHQSAPRVGYTFVRGERRGVGEPARTRVDDTILDLAGGLSTEGLCALFGTAISQRLTTADHLAITMAGRNRQAHRRLIAEMLGDSREGALSPLERRYFRDVERAHGLPHGRRQATSTRGPYVSDVRYDDFGLLVELDGRTFHRGMKEFDDMWRDNVHSVDHLVTQRYGMPHVFGGACRTARLVAATLHTLGWRSAPQTCHHCRRMPINEW